MRLAPFAVAVALGLASVAGCADHAHLAGPKDNTSVHGGTGTDADKGEGATSTTEVGGSSTTFTTITVTGDVHSSFCTQLGHIDDGKVADDNSQDPDAVREGMTRYRAQLEQLDAAAPDAIEPDVHVIAKGIADLDDALRSVGYSWDDLASSEHGADVVDSLNDPRFATAGDHVSTYRAQVCHL